MFANIKNQVTLIKYLAGALVLCWGTTYTAHAIPLSQISQVYFFGDSLTDGGFNDYYPTPAAGKAPTFTTYGGFTWAQYIAKDIKGLPLPDASQYPYMPVNPPYHPNDLITNNTTPVNAALCPGNVCPVSGLLTGINYACGGSTTNSTGNGIVWAPSLHGQISQFLNTHPVVDPNAVYFIWSGANDILEVFSNSSTSPMLQILLLNAASTAANNIASEVARLSARGAKRIVVISLPNIGYTPLINDLVNSQLAPVSLYALMKTITFSFNSMLNQKLGEVIAQYGTKILYVDVYTLLDNVILASSSGRAYIVGGEPFYFTNYTAPVCGYIVPPAPFVVPKYVPALDCNVGPNGYLFADDIHPTGTTHRLVSLYVEQQIGQWG